MGAYVEEASSNTEKLYQVHSHNDARISTTTLGPSQPCNSTPRTRLDGQKIPRGQTTIVQQLPLAKPDRLSFTSKWRLQRLANTLQWQPPHLSPRPSLAQAHNPTSPHLPPSLHTPSSSTVAALAPLSPHLRKSKSRPRTLIPCMGTRQTRRLGR